MSESFNDYVARLGHKLSEAIDPAHAVAGRKYRREPGEAQFTPAPYPGCTVLLRPYPIRARGPLIEASRQLRQVSARIACVPEDTLHVTVADLLAGESYQRLNDPQRTAVAQLARSIVAEGKFADPVRMEVEAIGSFPGTVVALLSIPDRTHFRQIAELREQLYGDPELSAFGVRRRKAFVAHVTLGYLEEPPLSAEEVAQLGRLKYLGRETLVFEEARVFVFPHMSRFIETAGEN